MKYRCSPLKLTENRWMLVGEVPVPLSYVHKDGTPITNEEVLEVAFAGLPRLACQKLGLTERYFNSEEETIKALEEYFRPGC